MRECFHTYLETEIDRIGQLIGCKPEKEAGNENNAKASTCIKPGETSGLEEELCDLGSEHMRCLWNFQVHMLNMEVRGKI